MKTKVTKKQHITSFIKLMINPINLFNLPYLYIGKKYNRSWSESVDYMIDNCHAELSTCTVVFKTPSDGHVQVWISNYPYSSGYRWGGYAGEKVSVSPWVLSKLKALHNNLVDQELTINKD